MLFVESGSKILRNTRRPDERPFTLLQVDQAWVDRKIGLTGARPFLGGVEIERQRAIHVFDAFLAQRVAMRDKASAFG
jgi:hypothetical protein